MSNRREAGYVRTVRFSAPRALRIGRIVAAATASAIAGIVAMGGCQESGELPKTPSAFGALVDGGERIDGIARACVKLTSCAHSHDAPRDHDPAACVDWWLTSGLARGDEAFASCVANARSCAAVDGCARERGGDAVAAEYCRDHAGEQTACVGTRRIVCSDDDPYESTSVDCAAMNATCGEVHVAGGLVVRGCASAALCPPGAPDVRCDGEGAIVTCRDGAVERTACAPGVRCKAAENDDGSRTAMCEGPGHAHCKEVGKSRCAEGRLVQCVPHGELGEERVTDCNALGLACDSSSGRPGCRVAGPRVCEGGASRCEGDALSFCAAGKPVRVSCAELGFSRCDPDGHGLDASCAPLPIVRLKGAALSPRRSE